MVRGIVCAHEHFVLTESKNRPARDPDPGSRCRIDPNAPNRNPTATPFQLIAEVILSDREQRYI